MSNGARHSQYLEEVWTVRVCNSMINKLAAGKLDTCSAMSKAGKGCLQKTRTSIPLSPITSNTTYRVAATITAL